MVKIVKAQDESRLHFKKLFRFYGHTKTLNKGNFVKSMQVFDIIFCMYISVNYLDWINKQKYMNQEKNKTYNMQTHVQSLFCKHKTTDVTSLV